MFVGHFAPAFVAATHPKAPNLGLLFVGAQLVDFAFFAFILGGVEHMRLVPGMTAMNPLDLYYMPYTHSLLGGAVWGIAFAILIYGVMRSKIAAVLGGVVVVTHWFLDLLVHRPDLTIAGSPPKIGLSLWDQPALAMSVEIFVIGAAMAFYLSRTRRGPGKKNIPFIALFLLLAGFQAIDWFGPTPEGSTTPIAIMALLSFSLAALVAWWAGRSRIARGHAHTENASL